MSRPDFHHPVDPRVAVG